MFDICRMELRTFHNKETFIQNSLDVILHVYKQASQRYIGLSGGSTPKSIYKALGEYAATVENTHFFLVDERYVPTDHIDSNYRMIHSSLGSYNITHVDTSLPMHEALTDYEKKLQRVPHQTFDLIVLGLGEDGHIASLFPGGEALHETRHLVAHTSTQKHPGHDRITMTFPLILAAKKILLLVAGQKKEQTVEHLLHDALSNIRHLPETMPASKLLDHPNLLIHYLT